jgi:hypothetical protein
VWFIIPRTQYFTWQNKLLRWPHQPEKRLQRNHLLKKVQEDTKYEREIVTEKGSNYPRCGILRIPLLLKCTTTLWPKAKPGSLIITESGLKVRSNSRILQKRILSNWRSGVTMKLTETKHCWDLMATHFGGCFGTHRKMNRHLTRVRKVFVL